MNKDVHGYLTCPISSAQTKLVKIENITHIQLLAEKGSINVTIDANPLEEISFKRTKEELESFVEQVSKLGFVKLQADHNEERFINPAILQVDLSETSGVNNGKTLLAFTMNNGSKTSFHIPNEQVGQLITDLDQASNALAGVDTARARINSGR